MERMMYLKDVVTLSLDEDKCSGCGICLDVCPQAVIAMNGEGRAWIKERDACMECGACSRNCPTGAFSVQAGVGCAAAVINTLLGKGDALCCGPVDSCGRNESPGKSSCC
jgi:NAD-dependent dihydropyrimidine dehydrogenase PreA subunit